MPVADYSILFSSFHYCLQFWKIQPHKHEINFGDPGDSKDAWYSLEVS
jgi:hypothetical protein